MSRKTGNFILFLSKAILFIAVVVVFFAGIQYFYPYTLYYRWGNVMVMVLYTGILYFISRLYNGFNFGNAGYQEIMLSWALCLLITNGLLYFVFCLRIVALLPVAGFIAVLGVQLLIVIPLAALCHILYYRVNPAQKTAIIYGNTAKLPEYHAIISKQRGKFRVVHVISQNEATGKILDIVDASESIFFMDVEDEKQEWLFEYCYLHNKNAYIMPTFKSILINTAGTMWLSNTPLFSLKSPDQDLGSLMIKRCVDIVVSLAVIILLSWLMIGVWAAVRFYDNYPAIYKQVRVTKGRKLFTLYKFRSMRPNAEDDGVPRLTSKDDNRITPIGRFIRKTRIDELPQLFNVLSGSMSLVGPRPERPEIAKQYEEIYPNFAFRTKVKAGITGFAQIYGRYNTAPEEKLFLDIMYIETFSLLQDLKLMLQTVKVIFQVSSTEGIDNDSTTALKK